MSIELNGFFLPGFRGRTEPRMIGGCRIHMPVLQADDVRLAVDWLLEAAERTLPGYSTDDLAEIFARTAEQWGQPSEQRRRIALAISGLTGLSPAVVEKSIDVEQSNCRRQDLLAALDRDLGDHRCLDQFVSDERLGGLTRAFGPKLTGAVLTSNVPGLSYLSIVRALMVKSPLAAKLSRFEPIFGPAWLQTLAEVEPPLAECVALFCWPGQQPELEGAMLNQAERLMVYGGPETTAHYREAFGPRLRIIEHGHKLGLGLIGREALNDEASAAWLAERVALDTVMFDQRACVSPQMLFIERGSAVSSKRFASMLSQAMSDLAAELPFGSLSLDAKATLAQELNLEHFAAAQTEEKAVFQGTGCVVVHESEPRFKGVLPTRFLRVCPIDHLESVFELLRPHGQALQNVGLAAGRRAPELAEQLAGIGVSRITALGSMHKPSMRWKHDGLAPFADLVRWTDVEMLDLPGGRS
jgi:hypothetical protein